MNGPYINIFSRCYYIATYYMQEGKFILFSTKGTRLIRFFINVIALVIIYSVLSNPQGNEPSCCSFSDTEYQLQSRLGGILLDRSATVVCRLVLASDMKFFDDEDEKHQ